MVLLSDVADDGFKSYYDIKGIDGLKYIFDEKNINKIRNKSLRTFLKFYEQVETTLLKTIVSNSPLSDNDLHNFKGANLFLSNIKKKEINKAVEKLNPEIQKIIFVDKKDISFSQRTIYDYMNAIKYLKAVDKANAELQQIIFEKSVEKMKNSHNMTKKGGR